MAKKILGNKGTILALVMIICSVMILTGTVLLSTTLMDYKMKKINSEVKKALYQAEAAIDEAYVITLEFVASAIEYAAKEETDFKTIFAEFLKGNCSDSKWEKSLLNVLKDNSEYIVNKDGYPSIDVTIAENEDYFQLEIISTYMINNVKKAVSMLFNIYIPDDKDEFDCNSIKAADLIQVIDWKVVR